MDLLISQNAVRLSRRKDAVRPANAKRADVNYIRKVAQQKFDELVALWESAG